MTPSSGALAPRVRSTGGGHPAPTTLLELGASLVFVVPGKWSDKA